MVDQGQVGAPYSNREIDAMVKEFGEKLDNYAKNDAAEHKHTRDALAEIKQAFQAHTKDEDKRIERLENWRWFLAGGMAVIGMVILPVIFFLIQHYSH